MPVRTTQSACRSMLGSACLLAALALPGLALAEEAAPPSLADVAAKLDAQKIMMDTV